jgi:hypothetical protein
VKEDYKNNIMKKLFLNQKGMALLTTLIFVFILVTFAVALLTMTSNDSKMSTLQRASNKAFYLADAGIEEAFWKLNTPVEDGGEVMLEWRPTDYPEPGTNTEYYQVTIINIGDISLGEELTDKIKITSTGVVKSGEYSSGKRTIEVTAKIDFLITSKYIYAILADKVILFQGTPGPEIDGDVHSNDDILVSGKFGENYEGTGTCSGEDNDLDDTPDGSYTGVPNKPIPTVDYDDLRERAIAATTDPTSTDIYYHTSDIILGNGETWGIEANPITGIHFIEGSLEAKQGSEIWIENGAIIATGDIDIKEGSKLMHDRDVGYLDPDDYATALAIIAQGDIRIFAKGSVVTGVVQSILPDGTSEGYIELKNGCDVLGSVIADSVYVRNKCSVTYDEELSKIISKGDDFYIKTSWREAY